LSAQPARIRLVIESVFSTLKRQMRLETHLAKTPGGLLQRIAQRLLALTLGIQRCPTPFISLHIPAHPEYLRKTRGDPNALEMRLFLHCRAAQTP
jgi:hypothetical protein